MIRENIVEEVTKILHGPIGGAGEELDKNPLDFYSVGVLFPRIVQTSDIFDPNPENQESYTIEEENEIEVNIGLEESQNIAQRRAKIESEESEDSGEFELTTKFRPSAAGLSVLTKKNVDFRLTIHFANYVKKQVEKNIVKGEEIKTVKLSIFKHIPKEYILECKNGKFSFSNLDYTEEGNIIYVSLDEGSSISITTRRYPGKGELEIKTFTLINSKQVNNFKEQKKVEDCIFQPAISIHLEQGFQPFEDLTDLSLLSSEDLNLKLLYRNYKKYALGHGISVNWEKSNNLIQNVYTQVLPQEKVNGVDLNPPIFKGNDILYMKRLAGLKLSNDLKWNVIKGELVDFVNLYKAWTDDQIKIIRQNTEILPQILIITAEKNLKHCEGLYNRMLKGIELLNDNSNARGAFEDANRAMFMQRVMADFSKHRRNEKRVQHNNAVFDDALPDYSQIHFNATSGKIWQNGKLNAVLDTEKRGTLAKWRPFQLAFLLAQIEGILDPSSADRDTVDLIWFPTGGGKTEAYLGLTAFAIFFRRLTAKSNSGNPDNGAGVTVLMRYTLRLLNKQQFERASIIICACDLIRRSDPAKYGHIRISNGIWMGRSMTPNNEKDQWENYEDYIKQIDRIRQPDPFKNSPPLLSCPCCGNRLIREIKDNQVIGRWGYLRSMNNRNRPTGRYLMSCTNTLCDFHVTQANLISDSSKLLPVYEVDETIYRERPSLLFSTVDKFVQLAWKNEAFNIFNIDFKDGGIRRIYPAPELIIQDELHLISSALGTIYGVYEIVIDKMCREAGGSISKIIGATATVRNAEEQCKRLYGRSYFLQFPPPATDADDSFYAKKIIGEDPKNRLYVGFMPSGVTTSTALIRLASVLLERIPTLILPNDEVDKHYTLVVYFNALKELGKFRTFLTDDIVAYRKLLANHFNTFIKPFNNNALCELSSVMTSDDITKGLDKLEKTTLPIGLDINNILVNKLYEKGIRTFSDLQTAKGSVWNEAFINQLFFNQIGLKFTGDFITDINSFKTIAENLFTDKSQPIQIAPATNMISVGVDIPRLNTMIINGQPKTTAEYIQASSRVGRDDLGVVFTFLAPTKNRDRSHYEQFKAFHQAYYYFVESSSVTPYSVPALEKVIPTVLIALTRSLYLNGDGGVFIPSQIEYINLIEEITEEIITRGSKISKDGMRQEIADTVNRIKLDFFEKMNGLGGNRRLAEYIDFIERNPLNGMMQTKIKNQMAVYNAQSQFTESILKDHIPTMGTLRNVEASTKISIKN